MKRRPTAIELEAALLGIVTIIMTAVGLFG